MSPRDAFLSWCSDYGLSGYWTAVADTFARFESSYSPTVIRVEPIPGSLEERTSYGLFQVLGQYSPMRDLRLAGVRFGVSDQFEEWWQYMQDPYVTGPNVSQREMFRRYNGSGSRAEAYADRAMNYMRENWAQYITDLSPEVVSSPEPPSPAPSSGSAVIVGVSLLLVLLSQS